MSENKIDIAKLEDAASKLRAIAHPMRIAIIDMLDSNVKMNVTQIHNALDIEQAAASNHLNILKNKGVLSSRRDGKNTYYSLNHSSLHKIIECIEKCNS